MPRTNEQLNLLLNSSTAEAELSKKTFFICVTVSIVACQLSFICGAAQGYSAILTPQLIAQQNSNSTVRIGKYEASWIASLGTICRPLGALFEGITVDKIGRKTTMALTAVLLACSWIAMALSRNIVMIYLSRILISIGLGMVICVGLYIAEISLPKQRGSLLSMITPITMFGTLTVYLLGSVLTWNTVAVCFAVHSGFTMIVLYFVPESYIWHLLNGRRDKAVYSLLRLRNGDLSQTSMEIAEAEAYTLADSYATTTTGGGGGGGGKIIRDKKSLLQIFTTDPAVWKPFLILTGFSLIQQQAGYTVIIYYAVDFFSSFDTPIDGYTLAIVFAGISIAGSSMLTFVVHVFDRKTLLAVSGLGMCLTMSVAALFVTSDALKSYNLVPVISIFCYIFCCMLGMIDIPWMIVGELFPSKVRGQMSAAVTVVVFFVTTAVLKSYSLLTDHFGQSVLLWYFAAFSLLAVIYSTVFFPETKDKSLFEIEDDLRERR